VPVPAVALTGYSGTQTRAVAVGFQAHVLKPIDPDRLALMIAKLVGRPSSPQLMT
jgi:CheY-like chemotaxis protein